MQPHVACRFGKPIGHSCRQQTNSGPGHHARACMTATSTSALLDSPFCATLL